VIIISMRQLRLAVVWSAASLASLCGATGHAAAPVTAKKIDHPDWCQRFAQRIPDVTAANCQQMALSPSGGNSVDGIPLLVKRFTAKAAGGAQPLRVLLLGGIHGDELTASAIVFQWMQWMQSSPAQNFTWTVIPVVNPDGLLATPPQRMNAHGVDLNRNFPTPAWQQDAPRYWTKVTGSDPRRFPGKAPLSEPETRWVSEEIERYQPNAIISVHAPYGVLDFDGPAPTPHQFGRLIFNPVGVYPGSLGNYSGVHKNVPVITIELPNAATMPSDAEAQRIWQDMLAWIQRNVHRADVVPAATQAAAAPANRAVDKMAVPTH
jgi:hypothetical protein